EPLRAVRTGFDREVARDDDEIALGARRLRPPGGALKAVATQRTDQRPRHDADTAMAEPVQVVHRLRRGLRVVDVDARDAEARVELAAVDDRRAARGHRAHELR